MINLDGIGYVLALLALYGLVLLGVAALGLVWIIRGDKKRWVGAGILVALIAYGVAPTLITKMRGDRLGARLEAASFWPESLSFAGANVLHITPNSYGCDALCEALFTRSGAASLHQMGFDGFGLPQSLAVTRLFDPANHVTRIGVLTNESGYLSIGGIETVLPHPIDWILVIDQQGNFARANAVSMGLNPDDAPKLSRALHLYRVSTGRLDGSPELIPVVRMFAGRRSEVPLFMPFASSSLYSNDTTAFSNALETWICGPLTAPWEDRCPYLF